MPVESAEAQLKTFVAAYTPEIAARTHAVLKKMRTRLRGASLLVYDNYNALAVAFAPGDKTSAAIFSIAVYPRWVSLFFVQGAKLRDPHKLLKGSGKAMRHVILEDASDLDDRQLRALMDEALRMASPPLDPAQRGTLIIKSVSPNKRPRRPEKLARKE